MLRRTITAFSFALLAGCSAGPTSEPAESSEGAATAAYAEVRSFGDNPGELKMYEYVPANLKPHAPVVLVLHGCMQGVTEASQTGWNSIADELGFLVVYPEQQTNNNAMRCFNWAGEYGDPANLERGKGENQSVKQMVDKAVAMHDSDTKRVFITGFSGGGGMASLMAATWPDVFAAAATEAGIPYDCTREFVQVSSCLSPGKDMTPEEWGKKVRDAFPTFHGPWPRMTLWQGSADNVVSPTNRTQLIKQWTNVHGVSLTPSATDTVDGASHAVFKDASGNVVVETYEVRGMGHGVPVVVAGGKCGSTSQYAIDKGICASRHIADFFGLTAH
jgi:poly(hydroxyalkanoate) depolymerase family esterase